MSVPQTLWMPNTVHHEIGRIEHGKLRTVDFVVVHINVGTTEGTFSWWAQGGHEADGAQVQIDRDGTAYQCTPLNVKCWHAGNVNDRSIGIEHEGFPGQVYPHIQLHASANRAAWIHHECGLGRPKVGRTVFPHSFGGAAWGGHACPGPFPWGEYQTLLTAAYMDHWGR